MRGRGRGEADVRSVGVGRRNGDDKEEVSEDFGGWKREIGVLEN